MRNIILLEGIASSGKTTIERLLAHRLPGSVIVSEDEALMPIIDNKDVYVARAHLQKQLHRIVNNPARNAIVDRFHFTHVFRTSSAIDVFSSIEDDLQKAGNVLVVLLTIDLDRIKERIEETMLRRKDNWKKGARGALKKRLNTTQSNRFFFSRL